MSRTLPLRPDFTQLRHQAKDLRRAHGRRESAACPVLRRLRRFASASEADILAQPLALHEAQYALAMEYGFASWNALKRYVEKVSGRPSPVRREKDRTYVAGLEKHPIASGDCEHENSVLACLAGVMAALGEDMSYEYLTGASGAAFRVQLHQPNWCPSAACAPCGYDCVPGAMKVTGCRMTWIDTQRDGKWLGDGVEKAVRAVAANVDRGVPVILAGKEAGLIVGYHTDGKLVVRPYAYEEEGYKDAEVFGAAGALPAALNDLVAANDWAWGVGVIEPEDVPQDRREAVANSLRLAVRLATTERFGEYLSGFAALRQWADGLMEESRFAGLTDENWFGIAHANGYCYGCLWASRKTAEKYLREAAAEYKGAVPKQLLEIAELYKQVHQEVGRKRPEYDCAWSLMPWRIGSAAKWTSAMRRTEAETLRAVLALEQQAVSKIQDVIRVLDGPA
jgi:hypothetical protein